jgi:hypothetical protein
MRECRFHPGPEAVVEFQKMEFWYCRDCLEACQACTAPCLYCKLRQGCVIWELRRQEARKRCQEGNK